MSLNVSIFRPPIHGWQKRGAVTPVYGAQVGYIKHLDFQLFLPMADVQIRHLVVPV